MEFYVRCMGNQAEPENGVIRRVLVARRVAFMMLLLGTVWDLCGRLLDTSPWWHSVSFAMIGLGATIGLLATLFSFLHPAIRRRPFGSVIVLALVLLSLVLRGHRDIPPDRPLVAVEIISVLVLGAGSVRRRLQRRTD